ncbi:hypothetical protein ACFL1N_05155 [Thermodesulfobacteriota bacterium]
MKNRIINLNILLIILLWISPSNAIDKEALFNKQINHKARSSSTWSELTKKDLKDRILPAPDIIIDYLINDNLLQGYKKRPKMAVIDDTFFLDIVGAITELPLPVRNHIHEHLAAVFLVEELGGTGFCELLRDFDKNRLGFIVIDVGALSRKANEWASWKENSPFAKKGIYTIEAEIERESNNIRKAAIQYILLHEIGHLIGVAKEAHPHWIKGGDLRKWPFSNLSWISLEGGLKGKSRYDNAFTNRGYVRYYLFKEAPLASTEIDNTYVQLLKTDFVSLYAATNTYDDFAETYAMYVHVVLQNKPWKIRIIKEGKIVKEITNPILDNRCATKKRYMDMLFK